MLIWMIYGGTEEACVSNQNFGYVRLRAPIKRSSPCPRVCVIWPVTWPYVVPGHEQIVGGDRTRQTHVFTCFYHIATPKILDQFDCMNFWESRLRMSLESGSQRVPEQSRIITRKWLFTMMHHSGVSALHSIKHFEIWDIPIAIMIL